MTFDIHIKQGIGELELDMLIEKIIPILGEADEVETIENAIDETTTVLRYKDSMTLFFEGYNPTLTCIDIIDEGTTLFGQPVFDMEEKEIVKLMVDNNYFEQDIDIEAWGERRISFNEGNIDFFFEDEFTLPARTINEFPIVVRMLGNAVSP